jgi:hypothetical protein
MTPYLRTILRDHERCVFAPAARAPEVAQTSLKQVIRARRPVADGMDGQKSNCITCFSVHLPLTALRAALLR